MTEFGAINIENIRLIMSAAAFKRRKPMDIGRYI